MSDVGPKADPYRSPRVNFVQEGAPNLKVAIVAPMAVPVTWGGAERAVDGLCNAINQHSPHSAEVVKLPVNESTLVGVVAAYRDFSQLDLSRFDQVISVKYPAWIARHHAHRVLMFHPLRGLYDSYHYFGLPLHPAPQSTPIINLLGFIGAHRGRAALGEFFTRFGQAVAEIGANHPDLAFPGPVARALVHWLDSIALNPGEVIEHLALSRTVAHRADYFPPGVRPKVLYLPGDLPEAPPRTEVGRHLFTASRLDGAKRIEMIVDAMAHVSADVDLLIAGTGPHEAGIRQRAAGDPRIKLLGFVPEDSLLDLYRNSIAVPFVPADEDLGLVCLEAFSQGVPVITTTDAGGPTEFVHDGLTGLVSAPTPASLGRAMHRLAADPGLALVMGREGQLRSQRVSWEHVVDDLFPRPIATSAQWPAAAQVDAGSTFTLIDGPQRAESHRPRVAVLATFGIDQPAHGGQIRARSLYGRLADNADVHLVALTTTDTPPSEGQLAPGLTQTVVPRSSEQSEVDNEFGLQAGLPVTDILAGTNSSLTPTFQATVDKVLGESDLVILAEPYLLPVLQRSPRHVPFIYDAYNVEHSLKASALATSSQRATLLDQVERIERAAVTESMAVVACSAADAVDLASTYNRSRAAFAVIPNGTRIRKTVPTAAERARAEQRWLARYRRDAPGETVEHLAVFFGSWHPPNLDAAELLIEIAPSLPNVLFLSCGSHGSYFANRALPHNVVFAGPVGSQAKEALLACAGVALNPMRTGSGTNLKLVEYLDSATPVVSTPFGARGVAVEDGRDLLLASPENFANAIREVFGDPAAAERRALAGRRIAEEQYDWDRLGDRLADLVRDIAVGVGPK